MAIRRISGPRCHLKPSDGLAEMAYLSSGVTECSSHLTGTLCDITIPKTYRRCPLSPSPSAHYHPLLIPQRITCSLRRPKTRVAAFGVLGLEVIS